MSSSQLKIFALVCMVIDHIGEFIPGAPIYFRWIERISAPIFIFVFVNSIDYTRNKSLFIRRLYLFNVITSICMWICNHVANKENEQLFVSNNIFATFVAIFFLISLLNQIKNRIAGWRREFVLYCAYQIITLILIYIGLALPALKSTYIADETILLLMQISCNVFWVEGNVFIVFMGVILYYLRNCKWKMSLGYIAAVGCDTILILEQIPARLYNKVNLLGNRFLSLCTEIMCNISGYEFRYYESVDYLHEYYFWIMIFALPFILLYNGKKGSYHKYFYYIFYPFHIIVLVCIQSILTPRC